ncbi:MAG TPA: hypothetical protein VIT41_10575 [Microlunatus sp.]
MLEVHGATFALSSHSGSSLLTATDTHPVLAAMPSDQRQRFTHFADVDETTLADEGNCVRWVRVIRPPAEGSHLPEVVLISHYLPEHQLRAHARRLITVASTPLSRLQAFHRAGMEARPKVHSGKLAALGLTTAPSDPALLGDLLVQAQTLITIEDTAAALAGHHPELASTDGYATTIVLHDHLFPDAAHDSDQHENVKALARAIAADGQPPWSPVVDCQDHTGKPLVAGYALDGIAEGQQLQTYGLRDDVQALTVPVTARARQTASNDLKLATKTWNPTIGTATIRRDASARPLTVAADNAAQAFKWTVSDPTVHHGIGVDPSSIKLGADGTFSIDASNGYLRTLYAGYRLLDDARIPIGPTTKLCSISATNSILGIPCPTDPTSLAFNLGSASAVELRFGSLGVTAWDPDVSLEGALLTGLWQFGIPVIFLAAGKALTSTKLFNKIVNDRDLTAIAVALGIGVVGGAVPTAAALLNTKTVLFSFGDVVLGLILQKGLEKLGTWLVEEAAEGAIASALGPVGWVMRVAAAALDIEAMAITTGECLASPAGSTITVSRAIDVKLALTPDPRHGRRGDTSSAVWPAVASNYVVTLQLQGGAAPHQLVGQFPATTGGTPLELRFDDVPAGGKLRIIAGVYSANGWLAGSWQSDWLPAVATDGTLLDLKSQHITELLVPLSGDTQYVFKERMALTAGAYAWQAGDPPNRTRTALDCSGSNSICELVGITMNNGAEQVGYAWRSSGQHLHPDTADAPISDEQLFAVQNLSVLADPGAQLKTSTIGFTNQPAIAYAPSTGPGTEIDERNFIVDPRGGGMHLRQVRLDGSHDFGLGDPALPSWGRLPLENVDAAAVHDDQVIACSWQQQKLMLLKLPASSSPDADAPTALMVSGKGLREGLVQGPRAITVAPDGRILVLESINRRVQSFDGLGNPVPAFSPGPSIVSLSTSAVSADLDAGRVPAALEQALRTSGALLHATIAATYTTNLDSGHFRAIGDPLLKVLAAEGVDLAYDPEAMSDPALSAQITVLTAGHAWTIKDPRGHDWHLELSDDGVDVYADISSAQIHVEQAGQRWLVVDQFFGDSWRLSPSTGSAGSTDLRRALSFFPLRGMRIGEVTYIDMAVEAQGYVYVLGYQNEGSASTDYLLDIYGPDGRFVSRTPDPSVTAHPTNVVAGKITVDLFRNLYGLTYETLTAPSGAPQPGLAHWMPTPPVFTLPLTSQPHFADKNISAVQQDFADHHVVLSGAAFISVTDPDGAWTVRDGQTEYHVYRSGDGLQVYSVPA